MRYDAGLGKIRIVSCSLFMILALWFLPNPAAVAQIRVPSNPICLAGFDSSQPCFENQGLEEGPRYAKFNAVGTKVADCYNKLTDVNLQNQIYNDYNDFLIDLKKQCCTASPGTSLGALGDIGSPGAAGPTGTPPTTSPAGGTNPGFIGQALNSFSPSSAPKATNYSDNSVDEPPLKAFNRLPSDEKQAM